MSRWKIPKPDFVTEDSELFLVNVLVSALTMVAIESVAPAGGTPKEAHQLLVKLTVRGYHNLLRERSMMSEDGMEDFLTYLRKELPHGERE